MGELLRLLHDVPKLALSMDFTVTGHLLAINMCMLECRPNNCSGKMIEVTFSVSQGSVATHVRCDEKDDNCFV